MPRSRCPNGTRKHPVTKKCESKSAKVNKNTLIKMKKCPAGKVVNPKTGRCVKAKSLVPSLSGKRFKVKRSKKQTMKNKNNRNANQVNKAKTMRAELLNMSKPYQEFKANQVVKKSMAKKIKANNLMNTRSKLRKIKN